MNTATELMIFDRVRKALRTIEDALLDCGDVLSDEQFRAANDAFILMQSILTDFDR